MFYTCIGKRRGQHGNIAGCINTSENPSVPARPEWGYLCTECSKSPAHVRELVLDLPDFDKVDEGNFGDDLNFYALEDSRTQESIEQEELDALEEMEL